MSIDLDEAAEAIMESGAWWSTARRTPAMERVVADCHERRAHRQAH